MTNDLPTAEQVAEALTVPPEIELTEEEKPIAVKLLPMLARQANEKAEAARADSLNTEVLALRDEFKKQMEVELAKLRKANEPVTPEEMAKLLNQEYLEFSLSVRGRNREERVFMIRELPVAVEKKLLDTVRRTLSSRLKEIAAIDWTAGLTNLEKVERSVDMVPGALEVLAECCATCLDPFSEDEAINAQWVLDNMNVYRMYAVLQAQAAASRWRDFFSLVYQAIPNQMLG